MKYNFRFSHHHETIDSFNSNTKSKPENYIEGNRIALQIQSVRGRELNCHIVIFTHDFTLAIICKVRQKAKLRKWPNSYCISLVDDCWANTVYVEWWPA